MKNSILQQIFAKYEKKCHVKNVSFNNTYKSFFDYFFIRVIPFLNANVAPMDIKYKKSSASIMVRMFSLRQIEP